MDCYTWPYKLSFRFVPEIDVRVRVARSMVPRESSFHVMAVLSVIEYTVDILSLSLKRLHNMFKNCRPMTDLTFLSAATVFLDGAIAN